MTSRKIGFIGAGKMATALASGFCKAGLVTAQNLTAYDVSEEARATFANAIQGCGFAASCQELVKNAEWIILAVKPQVIPTIVSDLKSPEPGKLFLSIMGGVSLDWLTSNLSTHQVIRSMPNTPCLIGKGAIGMAPDPEVPEEIQNEVKQLFASVGTTELLPERLIDAVTGLSGSGPAYVFQFIEALSDGGVQAGLPRDVAMRLATQTVIGAGEMVLQSGEHPGVLKDNVASPAGTTIAGIKALEERGFCAATMSAVEAATQRSIELGKS